MQSSSGPTGRSPRWCGRGTGTSSTATSGRCPSSAAGAPRSSPGPSRDSPRGTSPGWRRARSSPVWSGWSSRDALLAATVADTTNRAGALVSPLLAATVADAADRVRDQAAWLLPTLPGLPLLAALVLLAARRAGDRMATEVATGVAVVTFGLAVVAAYGAAPYDVPGPGLEVDASWIPALGVRAHLALD